MKESDEKSNETKTSSQLTHRDFKALDILYGQSFRTIVQNDWSTEHQFILMSTIPNFPTRTKEITLKTLATLRRFKTHNISRERARLILDALICGGLAFLIADLADDLFESGRYLDRDQRDDFIETLGALIQLQDEVERCSTVLGPTQFDLTPIKNGILKCLWDNQFSIRIMAQNSNELIPHSDPGICSLKPTTDPRFAQMMLSLAVQWGIYQDPQELLIFLVDSEYYRNWQNIDRSKYKSENDASPNSDSKCEEEISKSCAYSILELINSNGAIKKEEENDDQAIQHALQWFGSQFPDANADFVLSLNVAIMCRIAKRSDRGDVEAILEWMTVSRLHYGLLDEVRLFCVGFAHFSIATSPDSPLTEQLLEEVRTDANITPVDMTAFRIQFEDTEPPLTESKTTTSHKRQRTIENEAGNIPEP